MEKNKDNKKKRTYSLNLGELREPKKIDKQKIEKDVSKFEKILENFSYISEPIIHRRNSALTKERVLIKNKININIKLRIEEQIKKIFLESRCNIKKLKDKISNMNVTLINIDGKLTNIDGKLTNIDGKLANMDCILTNINDSMNDMKGIMNNNNEILKKIYNFMVNNNKSNQNKIELNEDSKIISNQENKNERFLTDHISFSFINKKNNISSHSNEEANIISNILEENITLNRKSKSKIKKNKKNILKNKKAPKLSKQFKVSLNKKTYKIKENPFKTNYSKDSHSNSSLGSNSYTFKKK